MDKYPMVELVTYIIGLNDPYGIKHSERVAELCLRMGKAMQMDDKAMEDLELAALLHDLGKLAIPEATRAKPGPLTEAETLLMRQHPVMGLNIIKKMNGKISRDVHLAIYHHHEDWSGTGYPAGLKGVAIPLKARIIRIADTFDALTHVRGYKPAEPASSAIQRMVDEQVEQKLFDPNLFSLFLQLVTE
jgi:putative nucleotidyltransferase with HDIG domain